MDNTLEKSLDIIAVEDAIEKFNNAFPNNDIHKLQIEYEGPILKYEFIGTDRTNKNTYEFNAVTGDVIKEKQKPLKEKQKKSKKLENKALNMEKLLSLTQINDIALEAVPADRPFQWEMDKKKDRTIWKIEIANENASKIYEVKVDAHDGTLTQIKLKN